MPAHNQKENVKQEDVDVDRPAKRMKQEPAEYPSSPPVVKQENQMSLQQTDGEIKDRDSDLSTPQQKLARLLTRQEFDFTRFGEKSYFVIFEGESGNAVVGKVGPSTKRAHVMHYLCDAWGLPQEDIFFAFTHALSLNYNGVELCEHLKTRTFGDFDFKKDDSCGDAEVVKVRRINRR